MAAKAIRNIQVPAYWPADVGVHVLVKSGVVEEVKKVMTMVISIGADVEPSVGMGIMCAILLVAEAMGIDSIDMVMDSMMKG